MPAPTPICPRCAYDLSGQVAAYESSDPSSCPLRATCPECGLEFWWADVFRPGLTRVRGFVEHSRLWLTPLTAWRTWAWTVIPTRFWQRVRLEHPPRVARAGLWLVLVLFLPFALAGIPGIILYWPPNLVQWRFVNSPLDLVSPWTQHQWGHWPDGSDPIMRFLSFFPVFLPAALALCVLFPLVLLSLRATRAGAKVSSRQVIRASAYQLAWFVPFALAKDIQIACYNIASHAPRMLGPPAVSGGQPWVLPPGPGLSCANIGDAIARSTHHQWPIYLFLITAWWSCWWWFTLARGFRLAHPRRIYLAAIIPSILAALILVVWHPQFLRDYL